MNANPWLVRAGVGVVIAIAGYVGVDRVYLTPRAALQDEITKASQRVAGLEKTLEGRADVRARAKAAGQSLVGVEQDEVSARFRDGLARVAEQGGLTGIMVESGRPQDEVNPLVNPSAKAPVKMRTAMRKQPDFAVVRGSVKGEGTLAQALGVLAALEAQAWVHRVEGFTIRPVGKERQRFEVRVEVATLFAPDLARQAGPGGPEPQVALASAKADEVVKRIAAKNVFVKPVAVATNTPVPVRVEGAGAVEAPTPRAAPFAPYEDWKLTGVALGREGAEAFFLNVRTGEKVTLQRGGAVLDAVFVEGAGERAVLEIGGKRFEVNNGQTLAARRPLG
ncbi:MAG: hypothetical protein HBSAPP03_21910 [Phycisphaerae bacterium]|nr:MAG: hypothetical protein HBSAPP03_21910 [Phycisphaerae bacterium]